MSLVWWSRKLDGGYVRHNTDNNFYEVKLTYIDDSAPRRDENQTPEEVEPYIRLQLDGKVGEASLSDVSFIFPEDQYKIIEGELVLGQRDTKQNRWRLIPTSHTYLADLPKGHSIRSWLNKEVGPFKSREELLNWKQIGPQLYGRLLASRRISRFQRDVFYGGKRILSLTRTPDTLRLHSRVDSLPANLRSGWGIMLDTDQPYSMKPAIRRLYEENPPTPLGGGEYHFPWTLVRESPTEDYQYTIERPTLLPSDGRLSYALRLRVDGRSWIFSDSNPDEIDEFFDGDVAEEIHSLLENEL